MPRLTGFAAYPSAPSQVGAAIQAAVDVLRSDAQAPMLSSWQENDVPGRFIVEPILAGIDNSDILVADITRLNFNVAFEIGYALGRRKRVLLTKNTALAADDELIREVGIFDTLGYQNYANSRELASALRLVSDIRPLSPHIIAPNPAAPVYIILPKEKSDAEIRLISRVKKARLQFRSFDPEEHGRLPAGEALENVARSHGVIAPLLSRERVNANVHNYRSSFVAGLTMGLGRTLLLLQEGEDPVPLDYRDLVRSFLHPQSIDEHVAEFAAEVSARFQSFAPRVVSEPVTFLERLNLGASSAENELQTLGHYYIETDEYRRALRGEVRVVTGRKGAGKTALFAQLRDKLRQDKSRIVLDLKPEGFQLLKLRERVLDYLEEGTKEHTITIFWEYLLLLEISHKLLEKDTLIHMRDNRLYEPYRRLAEEYDNADESPDGDFSERMIGLMQRIADDFGASRPDAGAAIMLNTGQISELVYRRDVAGLRDRVVEYLAFKKGLWILFDNLDKGWPAHGVSSEDVLALRALIDAMSKLERELQKREIEAHGIIFIRNDVYELLVSDTSDRGKVASITLDWSDPELLRELLRRRFVYTGVEGNPAFEALWGQIAVSHVRGEESSQYLIDRCLMRPRALIDLLRFCRGHAVNLGHSRIELSDIEAGEEAFSSDLLLNIDFEIRDLFPSAGNILYELIEAGETMPVRDLQSIGQRVVGIDGWERLFSLFLWYGIMGVVRDDGETSYIYTVKYDLRRMLALARRRGDDNALLRINPAFWRSLEVRH
jgi:hypothetical protein